MEYQGVSSFPKKFEFASLCSFICLYQLDLSNLLGVAALRMLISHFVDFLSIR